MAYNKTLQSITLLSLFFFYHLFGLLTYLVPTKSHSSIMDIITKKRHVQCTHHKPNWKEYTCANGWPAVKRRGPPLAPMVRSLVDIFYKTVGPWIHDSTSTSAPRSVQSVSVFFSLHALCCLHAFLDDTLEPFIMRPWVVGTTQFSLLLFFLFFF